MRGARGDSPAPAAFPPYLIQGRYSVSRMEIATTKSRVYFNARLTKYPDGSVLMMASDRAIFREPGWESASDSAADSGRSYEALLARLWLEDPERHNAVMELEGKAMETSAYIRGEEERRAENQARAMRRARSRVRDLALTNDFEFFVTLTLDASRVNRYDIREVTRKMSQWCDNQVRRKGLKYILVPELHKDGAIHFHGFFNGALEAVDSGTMTRNGSRPKKPRSARQRAQMEAEGYAPVYNLPGWTLGFTTAIRLYGERTAAVGYVCKYISKAAQTTGKIGGRWYYSGGDLKLPEVVFCNLDAEVINELYTRPMPGKYVGEIPALGAAILMGRMDSNCPIYGTEKGEMTHG